MIFVDTNVFMYAVGRPHPLRDPARQALRFAIRSSLPLATSSEVLQGLLHAYLPVGRLATLDAAVGWRLTSHGSGQWNRDVPAARASVAQYLGLSARDLLHLAMCLREVDRMGAAGLLSEERIGRARRVWPT
jgi:uncharacterized protein